MKRFDLNKTLTKINTDLQSYGLPTLRVAKLVPEDPYTFCEVVAGDYCGKGFAKRNAMDRPSKTQGIRLALRRAVTNLVEQHKSTVHSA